MASQAKLEKGHHKGHSEKDKDETFVYSADPIQAEIERRVGKVFDVFDTSHQRVVDVREVGTMIRALGKLLRNS